jgi:hypothetical protein
MRRNILTALALAAVASSAIAGGTAQAGVTPYGYVTVLQCTSLSGTAQYTPGLKYGAKAMHEIVTATIAGCSDSNGPIAGTGTFSAVLSSAAASRTVNNESGSYVINWPAAAGLNPSLGNLTTHGPANALYTIAGANNGGAYASGVMGTGWLVTGQTLGGKKHNAVVSESFVNTLPLTIQVNFG